MKSYIKKAVFPVAGLGTRFLPATKANPKEMLPIVDKPLIQYAVEEAISAGCTEMIFVTSSSKRAIEDHFDSNFELESKLAEQKKHELLSIVRNILPKGISCAYIRQPEALGLGHAVLCARPLINDEPFAVLLADDLIFDHGTTCLSQMVGLFNEHHHSVLALEKVASEQTQNYGIAALDCDLEDVDFAKVIQLVEKPKPSEAPSNWSVVGRYIFTASIFNYLETTTRGKSGEIQLTDAIAAMLQDQAVHAISMPGSRFDCGSKLGYLEATIAYALQHPELKDNFKELLRRYL